MLQEIITICNIQRHCPLGWPPVWHPNLLGLQSARLCLARVLGRSVVVGHEFVVVVVLVTGRSLYNLVCNVCLCSCTAAALSLQGMAWRACTPPAGHMPFTLLGLHAVDCVWSLGCGTGRVCFQPVCVCCVCAGRATSTGQAACVRVVVLE